MVEHLNDGCQTVTKLHKKFIKRTIKGTFVKETTVVLCNLTNAVRKACNLKTNKVYITSRCLKHEYDKRQASEYDFLLEHITDIVKYPEQVYLNDPSKRGDFIFVKTMGDEEYLVSLEVITSEEEENIFVATMFRTEKSYYKKFTLKWSWRDGTPSS